MELAFHLRKPAQQEAWGNFPEHLATFYGQTFRNEARWVKHSSRSLSRIYIGDEFCPQRLPLLDELEASYQFAEKRDLRVTLLTPVLTDEGMNRVVPLFDYLNARDLRAEVVVNDWGTLMFLRERYPCFQIAAGRILNKGFKDPRLVCPEKTCSYSGETKELFNESTFDGEEVQEMMKAGGVVRLEKDLLPYGAFQGNRISPFSVSVYFPFGYITTGRVCWVASFSQPAGKKFVPLPQCSQPCTRMTFQLKSQHFFFPIIQGGNTVFYLYTPAMLASLLKTAERQNIRLIYQGFAL